MAQWIETKIRHKRMMDDGSIKKVTQVFLVDALSFTEAEARIIAERTPYISGDFDVSAVSKSNLAELFWTDGDRWYKIKAVHMTIDEKTGQEKQNNVNYLVRAYDIATALANFNKSMIDTMLDYEITSIVETKIWDVYTAKAHA